jgi:hypothetical protein
MLLLLDNASGHPANLAEVKHLWMTVLFTYHQHHITLQPVDQGVITTLKAPYFCQAFMEMMRVLGRSHETLKDYWCSFNILKGFNKINTAWEEVSVNSWNGVWCKLLP